MSLLDVVETCYDAIPRAAGTSEEVGPFTLFLAADETGWEFYARPRLGWTGAITPDDVRRVLARQREVGVPCALEWIDEVTPSLRRAVDAAAPTRELEECPLLVLPATADAGGAAAPGRCELITPDHPDLAQVVGAVSAGFHESDDVHAADPGLRPRLIAAGHLVLVGAYDDHGAVVGGGTAAPRGRAAELMGIATVPGARRRGHGAAITRALVGAMRAAGVDTVFLSAGSETAAKVYRAVGFDRVGTAMIATVPPDQNEIQ